MPRSIALPPGRRLRHPSHQHGVGHRHGSIRAPRKTDACFTIGRVKVVATGWRGSFIGMRAPEDGIDESELTIGSPKTTAVGIPGVVAALRMSLDQMGPVLSAQI